MAIREDYVDGVETLLIYEEESHKEGDPYSWEKVDQVRDKPLNNFNSLKIMSLLKLKLPLKRLKWEKPLRVGSL